MITQMFKKTLLDFKYNNSNFIKCSRSIYYVPDAHLSKKFSYNKILIRYFSNKRNLSNMKNICMYRQIHPQILKKPLLCNKYIPQTIRISTNSIIINSSRMYSNTAPKIINEVAAYNYGIFLMISESLPVEVITEALRLMHYQTGLPWWASIMLTSIIARTIINLPLNILDVHTKAKQENLKFELKEIAEKIQKKVQREAISLQLSPYRAHYLFTRDFNKEQKQLYIKNNCHPFKSVAIILLQTPIWISFSVAVRNICYMLPQVNTATLQDFKELTTGGFGWIKNLIDIDHYFILPSLFGLSNLAILEINQVLFHVKDTKFSRIYKNFCRVLIIGFVPLMACLPSCLSLFWVTNNCCAIVYNLLLLSPKVRRLGKIPKTDSELRRPYTELYKRLLEKLYLKKFLA
ncbi:cytochrome c oxidase assembly protein COX18, mitochondrial [Apis cerana]|uniref:cytochrome c oxidase assembly protein COX18, mitochondrial n=1 Tax=Apis cerana TaxID=7461 RepID=UPI00109BECB2|nr:cytochrome c oxidase assembly protein COX18, mitochondrial [Apis cerana]